MFKNILLISLSVLLLICLFYPKPVYNHYLTTTHLKENLDLQDVDPSSLCLHPSPVGPTGPTGPPDPKNCPAPCKNGGTCDTTTGTCKCVGNWGGADCTKHITPGNYKIHNSWTNFDSYKFGADWIYSAPPDNCEQGAPTPFSAGDTQCCGDPTKGQVCYGKWTKLVEPSSSGIKISLGDIVNITNTDKRRKAVRIKTKEVYNDGLFIADVSHIPAGKGVWPAFWLTAIEPHGSKWPQHGEINIIEGVNSQNYNATTLHTRPGCKQDNVGGISSGGDCQGGAGCGFNGPDGSFGPKFNSTGGGVFACEWLPDETIKTWFFPRNNIPENVLSSSPNPSSWGKAYASFKVCVDKNDPYFKNLQLVVNTTLCGEWAGNKFISGDNSWTKCNQYVTDPANSSELLKDSYWTINSIKVFKK